MGEKQATGPALSRVMRARDYFTLAFGSIVGVGWMVLLYEWLGRGGPVGAMLGFLVCGIALVPVACVYGRLAERLPEAGTEIAYTAAAFPRGVSFATGWAMAFANAIVCPFEAVSVGLIASYAFPGLNSIELYRIGQEPIYLPHLLLGLGATALIIAVNYCGIRHSTRLQNLTTFGLLAIFVLFAVLGLSRGDVANLPPYFANEAGVLGGLLSVLAVLQVAPYYLMGFETIPKCAEEAAHDFPSRRFIRVMLWALAMATLFYVTVIGVVTMLQPWQSLETVAMPTAAAFRRAFGWEWLVQLIMLGVLLSLIKVFNGNFLAATRLLYAMGRRDLLGGRLGAVHQRYQTPFFAVAAIGVLTVVGTFLGKTILIPISAVGSLCAAVVWLATVLAYCRGAAGKLTPAGLALGVLAAIMAGAILVIVAVGFGTNEWIALAGWVAVGIGLWLWRTLTMAREPADPTIKPQQEKSK
jgi:APA family basic amino acid/polyamine antiporter